jgi:hypothetical protein
VCRLTKYLSHPKTGTHYVVPTVKYSWQYTAVIISRVVLTVHESSIFSEWAKCGLRVSCTEPQKQKCGILNPEQIFSVFFRIVCEKNIKAIK